MKMEKTKLNQKLGKWDKNIEFDELKKSLEEELEFLTKFIKITEKEDINLIKRIIYLAMAYNNLLNGLSAKEGLEAFKIFVLEEKKEFFINNRKNNSKRLVIIPEIVYNLLPFFKKHKNVVENLKLKNIITYFSNKLKVNAHSLRYAFFKKMLKMGYDKKQIMLVTSFKKVKKYDENFAKEVLLKIQSQ